MAATEQPLTIDDVELDFDQIDFTDLEQKYSVNPDSGIEEYVVVDGAPVAPESKAPMLKKVLTKLFTNVGAEIADGDDAFFLPIENGKTTGFLFIQFKNVKHAELAIKALNGKKLDAKHRLFLNKLSDVEKYGAEGAVSSDFKEPKVPEFKETDYLKSWLQDPSGRDQFIAHYNDDVAVNWHKKNQVENVIQRDNFTTGFSAWSPKGSYLVTIHPQGLQSWGGSNFDSIRRYFHPEVRLLEFSPDEKYLVSLSPEPIKLPPADHPARETFPFKPEDEGHKLVIWELATGLPVRTFALPPNLEQSKKIEWPLIKWSYDGKYFARKGPDALAIYESSTMSLLDKKILKIEGLQDFEFAPAGVQLASAKKDDPLSHVISYWTPETSNQTARVTLLEVPSKKVLRTVNLFQVSGCEFHWQDEAKYLAVKVDRHTKSKKTIFSSLEFFSLTEKEIPVEKIELKEVVINFAWEPKGDRFVTISRLDQGPVNLAIPKNNISFYAPEIEKKGKGAANANVNLKKFKNFKVIENKHADTLLWAPKGRFIAVANVASNNAKIDFFDLDYDGQLVLASDEAAKNQNVKASLKQIGDVEPFGATNLEWDPSGRYLAVWSSSWRHKVDNGYKVYDFSGHLLISEAVDNFKQFIWRPRPASLLTGGDRKKVRKNLREYSAQFEEQDAMEASAATREIILTRRKLLEEWANWRSTVEHKKKELGVVEQEEEAKEDAVIEEIKEEILEEKEEIVE